MWQFFHPRLPLRLSMGCRWGKPQSGIVDIVELTFAVIFLRKLIVFEVFSNWQSSRRCVVGNFHIFTIFVCFLNFLTNPLACRSGSLGKTMSSAEPAWLVLSGYQCSWDHLCLSSLCPWLTGELAVRIPRGLVCGIDSELGGTEFVKVNVIGGRVLCPPPRIDTLDTSCSLNLVNRGVQIMH